MTRSIVERESLGGASHEVDQLHGKLLGVYSIQNYVGQLQVSWTRDFEINVCSSQDNLANSDLIVIFAFPAIKVSPLASGLNASTQSCRAGRKWV